MTAATLVKHCVLTQRAVCALAFTTCEGFFSAGTGAGRVQVRVQVGCK